MRRRAKKQVDADSAQDPQAVRDASVMLLARRDFASGELRDKLIEQGVDAALVTSAVDELVEGGVLSDARYAENYVAYHSDRGQGPVRIAAELKALGIPGEIIDGALASGPDWAARAREARIRKFGLEPPENWPEKSRQARFLQYRGFSSDHIRSALGSDPDLNE